MDSSIIDPPEEYRIFDEADDIYADSNNTPE